MPDPHASRHHQPPESNLELGVAQPMAEAMLKAFPTLLSPAAFDKVLRGHGDTGCITLASDESISAQLLRAVRPTFPGSYSEEEDPRNAQGQPQRCQHDTLWVVDPVDGSGDRRAFDGQDRPAARGYSILAALVERGKTAAGLCARPAYGEIWHFLPREIRRFEVTGETLTRVPFTPPVRPAVERGVVRIGFRPAYPQTNFPQELLHAASQHLGHGRRYEAVEVGGAGDAFSQLIEGKLDLVVSGKKTDWKVWDTAPFALALRTLGGRLTDYHDSDLTRGPHDLDQWHTGGVIASVGCADAHQAFLKALSAARSVDPTLVFDPRSKS